jgi:hypothetical protein
MQKPSRNILRKMGLLSDQQGIMNRYLVEGKNWRSHLDNTKNFIRNCFPSDPSATVAILGSGWMLDIPAGFLLQHFREVNFYDINHPPLVMKQYDSFRNANFHERDLTGGLLEKVYKLCSSRGKKDQTTLPDEIRMDAKQKLFEGDYIFSVNLLNQLDILIMDYLKKFYTLDEVRINILRNLIQKHHLEMLPQGRSGLITDFEEIHLDGHGLEKERLSLIHCDLPLAEKEERWFWEFDTRKTYHARWKTRMNVLAIKF